MFYISNVTKLQSSGFVDEVLYWKILSGFETENILGLADCIFYYKISNQQNVLYLHACSESI